jgi:predicted PurR-regulated permease PerM
MGTSIAVKIIGVAAAVALLYFFRSILAPLCMAFVIVVLIHWIGDGISKLIPKAGRRVVTVITALVVAGAILAGFAIVSGGVARVLPLADKIAGKIGELIDGLSTYVGPFGTVARLDIGSLLGGSDLSSIVQGALQQVANGLSTLALTLLLVAFLLPSRPKLTAKLAALARSSEAASRDAGWSGRSSRASAAPYWSRRRRRASLPRLRRRSCGSSACPTSRSGPSWSF